jgi:pimeloyl-ACP methyl ester carboxylesterase
MNMRFRTLLRGVFFAITAGPVGLAFLGASGQAQNTQSKGHKENLMTQSSAGQSKSVASVAPEAIRPFHVNIADERLNDLRRRIAATQWPERELVSDPSQGVQLATMKKLAEYWEKNYDWRKTEARLNSYPQFVTNIDGLDIHFMQVKSKNPNALPVIITHGWPGSIIEQLKIIGPLTDPVAHGGKAEDSFDVVIPSLPGYGFSGKPTATGWDPQRVARAWAVLMNRLGYKRYVAQGGDWGNAVTEQMGLQQPAGLIGIHTNMPATVPNEINAAALAGSPAPSGFSADEKYAYDQLVFFYAHGLAMQTKWPIVPRRCTGSRIHRLAWLPGYSTTTRKVTT